jgi:hypothetical protein
MIRRDMLKSSLATMVCAPALPAIAGGALRLGPTPIHTEAEFRNALMEYVEAYRAFRLVPYYDDLDVTHKLRDAWWDTMERLRAMVLDSHGIDREGIDHEEYTSPMGLASRMIDLGHILIIAAVDATASEFHEQCTSVALVPRSAEMFRLLDGLPKEAAEEDDDEVADDKDTA